MKKRQLKLTDDEAASLARILALRTSCGLCQQKHSRSGLYCSDPCEERAKPPEGNDLTIKAKPYWRGA